MIKRCTGSLLAAIATTMVAQAAMAESFSGFDGRGPTGLNLELAVDRDEMGAELDGFGASYATRNHRFKAMLNDDGSLTTKHETSGGLGWRTTVGEASQRLELRVNTPF